MDRRGDRVTDPALRTSLAAYDDAALATLANPGLVRRAHRDLEEGKVWLVSSEAGSATIEADGQLVRLDTRGPRAADCACRSVAVCRHRIAAVLLVLAGEDEQPVAEEAAVEPEVDPGGIVADMDLARLEKWAGKAAWRAALEVAATAQGIEPSANALAVTFPDLEGPVRILRGQGFDGIVSKATKARIKPYHAAAVLAAMRHFGQAIPETAAEADAPAVTVDEVDPAFLAKVGGALGEVAQLGFNLAPLPVEESLFELSVSSRADSLPRLAAVLRAIAAQMRLRRTRSLDFDPDRMLELAASAFVLVRALGSSGPDRRTALAGKVRRSFAEADSLELVGCGGEQWRTISGARGVTAWFVEPASGRWLSTTVARGPGQDPNFIPVEAWRGQPLWHSEPLGVLAHARVHLSGAGLSADNRLSAPAAARATILSRAARPDPAWPGIVRNWDELPQAWLEQVGLGIDASESATACLIEPAQVAPPFFDDLAQQLVWPLRDRGGQWLALTIEHTDLGSTAIEALEATVKSGWQGMVLVRVERAGDRLSLRPITLFGKDDPVDLSLWQRPWRAGKGAALVQDWLSRLRPGTGRRFAEVQRSGTSAALAGAWRHLLDRAELGPALARTRDPDLAAQVERLQDYGLPRLAEVVGRAGEGGAELLTAGYALMLARQQRCAAPLLA